LAKIALGSLDFPTFAGKPRVTQSFAGSSTHPWQGVSSQHEETADLESALGETCQQRGFPSADGSMSYQELCHAKKTLFKLGDSEPNESMTQTKERGSFGKLLRPIPPLPAS
jgi:hypothetical protein